MKQSKNGTQCAASQDDATKGICDHACRHCECHIEMLQHERHCRTGKLCEIWDAVLMWQVLIFRKGEISHCPHMEFVRARIASVKGFVIDGIAARSTGVEEPNSVSSLVQSSSKFFEGLDEQAYPPRNRPILALRYCRLPKIQARPVSGEEPKSSNWLLITRPRRHQHALSTLGLTGAFHVPAVGYSHRKSTSMVRCCAYSAVLVYTPLPASYQQLLSVSSVAIGSHWRSVAGVLLLCGSLNQGIIFRFYSLPRISKMDQGSFKVTLLRSTNILISHSLRSHSPSCEGISVMSSSFKPLTALPSIQTFPSSYIQHCCPQQSCFLQSSSIITRLVSAAASSLGRLVTCSDYTSVLSSAQLLGSALSFRLILFKSSIST